MNDGPRPVAHHLDTAACGRMSPRVVAAVSRHLRREVEFGGYVAEAAARAEVDAARHRLAALVGEPSYEVAFGENATSMFARVIAAWSGPPSARVGVLASEFAPNRGSLAARPGVHLVELRSDGAGRLDLDGLAAALRSGLDLVTFPMVASHRGIRQPAEEAGLLCRDAGVALVLDVAQALGQIGVPPGATAYVGTSRKWLGGPRGVGFAMVEPGFVSTAALESQEANVAGRLGLAAALEEWSPATVADTRALAGYARRQLDQVAGWAAIEPPDEPTGIVTLRPPERAVPPDEVRRRLLAVGILVTAIEVARAPLDLSGPLLRVSTAPDGERGDIDALAAALPAATP